MYLRENDFTIKQRPRADQQQKGYHHRKGERRQKAGNGYAYISMVGWMDRREQTRRNDDRNKIMMW
jgi:hypothetical protein